MILLSVKSSEGPSLAVKVPEGIVVLKKLGTRAASLPATLGACLAAPGGVEQVQKTLSEIPKQSEQWRKLLRPETEVEICLPFKPHSLICVGRNYASHAQEAGVEVPGHPTLFAKLATCVIGPNEPILLPLDSRRVDYEAELGVIIGRRCSRVPVEEALGYIAGYTCLNDVSARDFQRDDGQWMRGKSQDTFGPMGPYVVTRDELLDPQNLRLRCLVNGEVRQDSNTSRMVFPVAKSIAFITRGITLQPGDVISTGTPEGIGSAMKPPVFLKHGDQVVVEIERVGRLVNPVTEALE